MVKNIEKEDIEKIKLLQEEHNQLIFKLGEFYYEKHLIDFDLNNKQSELQNSVTELHGKNGILVRELESKYGKGTIDIDKGVIESI